MMNSWQFMVVRVTVWIAVAIWAAMLIRTPWKTNSLPRIGTVVPGPDDPGLVLTALAGVTTFACVVPAGTTLHVRIDTTGLADAYVSPGIEDITCLSGAVWAQTWPALAQQMEMDFPL